MALNKLRPCKGRILISEPFLREPFFKRSVIILTEHNELGSMGFILNKPIEMKSNGSIANFSQFNGPLFLGGPLNKNQLFFIHTLGEKVKGSLKISDGLYLGGDLKIITRLIETKRVKPSEFRLFAGYSGWGPNQLNQEIKEKSWIVADTDLENVMDKNFNGLWAKVLKGMGKEFAMMANFPENPSLN